MRISSNVILALSIAICLAFSSCNSADKISIRKSIDLSGEWQLKLDSADKGLSADCGTTGFNDVVKLPGTLDENQKGYSNPAHELNHLHRKYLYTGSACYKKQIDIPQDWKGKRIQLLLERSKVTQVWLDTNYIGSCALLSTSQLFELGDYAQPGKHWLTIKVSNDPSAVPIGGSHAYSDDTQTNWNGILGRIELQAIPKVNIQSAKLSANIAHKYFLISLVIVNPSKLQVDGSVKVSAELGNSEFTGRLLKKTYKLILKPEADAHLNVTFPMGDDVKEWSEFSPNLYTFKFSLFDSKSKLLDEYNVNSGFREFKTVGTHFAINGLKTFLRGKHDGCVFPLTGHPPMDTAGWAKLFRIAQSYGINHYRFHSWCPPEEAFLAADALGIYLQPELPNWKSFEETDNPEHVDFQRNEGIRMLDEYGNHPSFVMLSLGNELGGSRKIMKNLVDEFRNIDSTRLYAQGSNNFFWDPALAEGDDYWTTDYTGKANDSLSTDVRGSFSFADSKSGGWINTMYPGTNSNYSVAIAHSGIPVIGHEVGQYLVFPDFSEINKYSGILEARNLAGFKKKIEDRGLLNQVPDFHKASGALAVLCYREEIEKALRTPDFGGFHLLDLQDYPGQGTALIGILDAFMQSKGLISPGEFHNFCGAVVPLAIFEKYCWTASEEFKAEIELANYSNLDLTKDNLHWILKDEAGLKISEGNLKVNSQQGTLTKLGDISVNLEKVKVLQKLQLHLSLENTNVENRYDIWIYPENTEIKVPIDLQITKQIDSKIIAQLNAGAKILYFPVLNNIIDKTVGGLFISDFWNYGMFKSIAESQNKPPSPGTMGILVNPLLPFFLNFPSEFHSNWQWWIIARNSRPFILDNTPAGYIPIVQVIDNFERNHKLGILFEFAVGKGKLLVCTTDIPSILNKPEGRQYYQAILNYASSGNFKPSVNISLNDLQRLFR